ncbi:MAG: TrmH family RNA methyltransferase, partial [Bacteroidales bacterium]|nr:TrmH family RNA methyltransferase [Bacteroidales bacterium]
KAALGATESVDWEYREDTLELVRDLTARGYAVYAVEQTENSTALQTFGEAAGLTASGSAASGTAAVQPLALVFGNEVHGVQQAVVDACRGTVEIPQEGTKHSLNVSVSIGIVLWELCRGGI